VTLEEARTILAIKLSQGRPSAETTAKRREAYRIIAASNIPTETPPIRPQIDVTSILETMKTPPPNYPAEMQKELQDVDDSQYQIIIDKLAENDFEKHRLALFSEWNTERHQIIRKYTALSR